ncbi:MAG TPA: DUF2779 domain-containing protein, partial [Bacteroidales bacterium]|nr:DUF2779 domain-containing protein [Bacteroidales bacterium]
HNTFYLNHGIFLSASDSFDLSKPTFLKLLIHQAAVPTVQGTKPYQPIVLAVCAYQPHNQVQQDFYWNNTAESPDYEGLADFLNQIWQESSCLIVYENNTLDAVIEKLTGLNPEIQWLIFNNLLQQANFMLPAIEETFEQNTLQVQIFPEGKPLKEESWLLKDLLDNPEQNSSKVNFQLLQYCKSLYRLYQYFLKPEINP